MGTSQTPTSTDTGTSAPPASAEPRSAQPPSRKRCTNCGSPLGGPYCARCGQKDRTRIGPIRRLLSDLIEELLSLDTRIVRTLRRLLFRPGALTSGYLGGHRTEFGRPVRLFIVTGLVLVLMMNVGRQLTDTRGVPMLRPVINTAGSGAHLQEQRDRAEALRAEGTVSAGVRARIIEGMTRAAEHPERIDSLFREWLSVLAAMVLPAFALLLHLLFRGRFYAEHVVHSLHLFAFLFLLLSLYLGVAFTVRLIDANALAAGLLPLSALATLGCATGYVYRSLRRVYGMPAWATLWRGAVLFILNIGVFAAGSAIYITGMLLFS